MKKIFLLLFVIALSFSGCEKDDICDANTPTTPRLVISFYDINNPSIPKSVTDLKIIGEGMTTGLIFNGNTVSIPLKTDADKTTYRFILNSGNPNPALVSEDILTFNYSRENIFVSRACGFKTIFTLDPLAPFVHTGVPVPDVQWMKYVAVKNSNIETENETHLEIFF